MWSGELEDLLVGGEARVGLDCVELEAEYGRLDVVADEARVGFEVEAVKVGAYKARERVVECRVGMGGEEYVLMLKELDDALQKVFDARILVACLRK